MVFTAYSALLEAQLRGALIVTESITMAVPYGLVEEVSTGLSVASSLIMVCPLRLLRFQFSRGAQARNDLTDPVYSENYPSPALSSWDNSWQNPTSGFWTTNDLSYFNISWTGNHSLVTWVTSQGSSGLGFMNSTQVNSTNPLILFPFKQYIISLTRVWYVMPDCSFALWTPGAYLQFRPCQ